MRCEWESIEKVKKHQGIFTKNTLTRLDGSKHDNKTQWACNGGQTIEKHTEKKTTNTHTHSGRMR